MCGPAIEGSGDRIRGVRMTEWSEERRAEVAAEFRKVGGGDWFESNGLTDSLGPLWRGSASAATGCEQLRE
jgi:hypothetical protein